MPRAINTEVRERVVATAHRLFCERGYKSVSMDDVAKAAGLKKANLFHYYPSKETLGLAVLDQLARDFRQRIVAEFSDETVDPIERVAAMYTDMGQKVRESGGDMPSVVGNVVVEMSSSHPSLQLHLADDLSFWADQLTCFLQRWKKRGYFKRHFDPRNAAITFISLMQGAVVHWKATLDPVAFDQSATCVRTYLGQLKR